MEKRMKLIKERIKELKEKRKKYSQNILKMIKPFLETINDCSPIEFRGYIFRKDYMETGADFCFTVKKGTEEKPIQLFSVYMYPHTSFKTAENPEPETEMIVESVEFDKSDLSWIEVIKRFPLRKVRQELKQIEEEMKKLPDFPFPSYSDETLSKILGAK